MLNKTTSDGSGTYTGTVSVTAKGSILSDQRVYFSASNPEMHRAGSAAVTGTTTVTTATDWDSTNVTNGTAKTAYTVSANITPGSWTGTMMFFATVSEKYDILLGDKTTLLLAQNENAANVKFSSSAPEIATVDTTGHVQTVSAGDTTITKMVYDSTGKNLLYTTVYNITVSPKQADMVTTRLAEPLKAITAAGTTIDTICFGNYSVPSDVTTYDVSGNGSNTIKAFVDGTALKVTNTRPSPVKFAEGNSVSFSGESAFANIKNVKYESVDTSKVTSANRTFYGMKKLSSITGLENWDTGKITDIRNIFRGCSALTSLDLSKWDTSNVTDMGCAFYGCTALNNLNIGTWNTSKVTAIDCLLYNCSSLPSIDISNWNTGNVTNMNQVFSGCSGLTTLNIGGWNTSKVTTMRYLFSNCSKLSRLALTQWDTAEVTDMRNMFAGCNGLVSLDVKSFNTANVTDMRNMFYYCSSLTTLDVRNFDTTKVTNMEFMFSECSSITTLDVSHFNTAKVTNMRDMFSYCSALTTLNLSHFDTASVTGMTYMFRGCSNLTTLDISNFDTSSVTSMNSMFFACSSLTSLDLNNFNTANVTDMTDMFRGCSSLTSLDVSNFDTAGVTSMETIFYNCSALTTLNLSHFDTAKIADMRYMFYNCSNLTTLDISNFDTSSVTNMASMFYGCSSLTSLDVSNFNTANVTNMSYMFYNCSALTTLDVSKFNTASVTNIGNIGGMLSYCNRLTSITVGSNFATANLPEAGWSNGMFYVNTKTALEVKGKISNALKAYDFATDNRVVSYVSGYAVTYIAENGKFSNGTNKNTVVYGEPVETSMTKVSKSGNVSDDGTTFYGYYEPNRETTDRVVIPGATQLTVTITYDTYSASTDWVCVYDGSVTPTASNYRQSVSKKLGGHSTSLKTKTYTIAGDTVQFYFKTNRYRNTDYYGYYATVEGTGYTQPITSGNYEIPSTTANDQAFTGWYNDSSYAIPFSKDDYIITGPTVVYGNVKSMNYVIDKTKLQKGLGNRFTTIIFCNKSDVPTGRVPYSYIQQENSDEIALYQVAETKTVYVAPSYDLDGAPMYAPEDCSRMFYGYSTGMNQSLTEIQFKNFNTSKVTNMEYMFSRNTYLTTLDISGFDMSNVTTIKGLFQWDGYLEKISAPNWNTSNLTDMSYAFDSCQKIQSIDIKNWDTSKVTTMSYAFDNCLALTSVNCNNWNTSSVTNMNHMFYQCCSLTNVPVSNWDTSKVEDMGYLFNSVGAYMNEVSLDVGNWNTSNVTNMNYLFCSTKCNSIDVSNWDTRNVTSMAWMFRATNCTTIKISNFDTSSVTDFSNMFDSCKNLTDLYVGKRFATANLPTTRGNGMFNFNSDNYGKHINIHGQVSDALKAYDYNNDKVGTPNFVDSQSLLANVFVTIATPETATQYDERPAA